MADLHQRPDFLRDVLASKGKRDDADDLGAIVRRASSPSFRSKASAFETPTESTLSSLILKTGSFSSSSGLQALGVCPQSNPPAAKHRKAQLKRVVCIPAVGSTDAVAGAAGQCASGDQCLLSDAWAWRKYGQKPIKGSPHPRHAMNWERERERERERKRERERARFFHLSCRGYYRCSSSKGCPARKQVERNPSDPSILVITYRGDHNHPWPLHRSINPVAGTRVRDPKERIAPVDSPESAAFPTCSADDHGCLSAMRDMNSDLVTDSVYADPNVVECASGSKHCDLMAAYEHTTLANEHERFMYAHIIIEHAERCDANSERLDMAQLNSLWDEGDDDEEETAGGADPYNLFPWP